MDTDQPGAQGRPIPPPVSDGAGSGPGPGPGSGVDSSTWSGASDPSAGQASAVTSVEAVFRAAEVPWKRVSPRLVTARLIVLTLTLVPLTVGCAAILWASVGGSAAVVAALAGLVLLVAIAIPVVRRVRSYGYAERENDLLVTSGILLRRLVIVPYGRMQLVDLTAGPIDRALGITTVQLHTAAATSDATIPGLPPDEAAAVRDRLAALGEERGAGL